MTLRLLVLALLTLAGIASAGAVDCTKRRCKDMGSCQEALDSLNICGNRRLDGDGDGVPCEAICGDSIVRPIQLLNDSGSSGFSCAHKTCKMMGSCEEAYFQLNQCGNGGLDRDGDGIPCEAICGG